MNMTETVKNTYCDVLSEHNGQKVSGASTYKDIAAMVLDDDDTYVVKKVTLDMCPACYAKYKANLCMAYDSRRRATYSFESAEETPSTT